MLILRMYNSCKKEFEIGNVLIYTLNNMKIYEINIYESYVNNNIFLFNDILL